MDKDECREMQKEELEAIEAIYMDDFIKHSKNKKGCAEFSLKLTPLQSMIGKDVHARVDLHVKFTSQYPYNPPILKLENAKGISDEMLSDLLKEINEMSQSLCGEVMILPLAHHCQSFLHKVNTPTLSFFEKMVADKEKYEKERLQQQQKIQAAELAENKEYEKDVMRQVKEELQKREEALKQEKRKRQISQCSPQNSMSSDGSETFVCSRSKQKRFTVMTFRSKSDERKLFCSTCLGHFYSYGCLMNAIDESSGKTMSVCEWKVKPQPQKKKVHFAETRDQTEQLSKQIQSIEQELYFLKSKISYKGILQYHNLEIDVNGNGDFSAKLLMDAVSGPSLSQYIQEGGQGISFVQTIARQLVEIFTYLHSKSVTHRDFNLLNTFMDSQNKVIISGYAVMRRISEVCINQMQTDIDPEIDPVIVFHAFQKQIKTGKSGDVFNFGLILLALFCGDVATEYPVVIPTHLPNSFTSFLQGCLNTDENQRLTFHQLSKHSFLFDKIIDNPIEKLDSYGEKTNKHNISFSKSADNVIIPFINNQVKDNSRLLREFEVIQYLGEGGFGSVIQVRNKLDSNYYAIKRIPLNPKSFNLNKKITREVKLLSRLNHENVVRYYNSWIEAEDIHSSETDESSTSTSQTNGTSSNVAKQENGYEESLLDLNKFEMPPEVDINTDEGSWCTGASENKQSRSLSSSEESSDSLPSIKKPLKKKKNSSRYSCSGRGESSEGILFQMEESMIQFGDMIDSDDENSAEENFHTPTSTMETKTDSETSSNCSIVHQFLYIQMEFCERLTLRNMIDEEELYKQPERVWRLFREIVEGLHHVHAQGIIHRDLKPVNIFMDSSDRVKIGDFGLATAHTSSVIVEPESETKKALNSTTDERMTGKVGTALYVAPELAGVSSRVKFSQKVDMYSLGIILFEMFYKPLKTGMERVKILGTLRTENVIFPDEFSPKKFAREQHLISWLLNHNPEKRPTTEELLNSGYVPPKLEDRQLDELLRHTLSQNNSTRYQRLMASLFTQNISPVFDQIYDSEYTGKNEGQIIHSVSLLQNVHKIIGSVFMRHGAVDLSTPLLMPKFKLLENVENIASFIDQSGLPVCLPYDSRLSFARYVARNNISNIRRYCFNQLYRKQKLLGAHPLCLRECCFDIVTDDNTSLIPEAEVILSVYEIIKEFPGLLRSNFYIRINHLSLLKAIFLQNNLSEVAQMEILKILQTTKSNVDRDAKIKEILVDFGFGEHIIQRILSMILIETPYAKAKELLQTLRKTKANISTLAKQAFQDLDKVLKCLQYFSMDMAIFLSTSLVINYQFFDGLVFQFVANNKRKKRHGGVDILAVGGRYDKLIESLSQYAETSSFPSAVGVSLSVDKILLSTLEETNPEKDNKESLISFGCDVVVCSITNSPKLSGLLQVLQELWAAGIKAALFSYDMQQDYTLEEIQEYCKENYIDYFVILKDTDLEFVKLRMREKDWFVENRISRKELCEYLLQRLSLKNESVKAQDFEVSAKPVASITHGGDIIFNFHLVGFERNVEANRRRKLESVFLLKYKEELHLMFGNKEIQVVIGKLESKELKLISGFIEFNSTLEKFESSLEELHTMFSVRGTHIKKICTMLYSFVSSDDKNSITILFSALTETYKVIM